MPTPPDAEMMRKVCILIGRMDKVQLAAINQAIVGRYDALNREAAINVLSEIKMGDRVEIISCKPKYLVGMRGTVQAMVNDRVQVMIDARYNTRRYNHLIGFFPHQLKITTPTED